MSMGNTSVRVVHVYEHEPHAFEDAVNIALEKITKEGGVLDEVEYAIDASTDINKRGGFGALIFYEPRSL